MNAIRAARAPGRPNFFCRLWRNIVEHPWLYVLILPVLAYYFVFCFWPMYGVIIAFQDYKPVRGISRSEWVGFQNFIDFFRDRAFFRVVRNTLTINISLLIFAFPFPILFAILLNEIRSSKFRKVAQTITYMPHFVSNVVICGLMIEFCRSGGLITSIVSLFGAEKPICSARRSGSSRCIFS